MTATLLLGPVARALLPSKSGKSHHGDEIAFTVPAVPVAQPRPRAVTMHGHARMANAPKEHPVHAFKASVRRAFAEAHDGPPLEGPLAMELTFVMPRPKAKLWKSKPMPREWYDAYRNDWDNLGKAVSDALNQLAYHDDGQLVVVLVKRVIAAGDERAHTWVSIRRAESVS